MIISYSLLVLFSLIGSVIVGNNGLNSDYNISKKTFIRYFSKIKKEFRYKHDGYLLLDHKPGEALVNLGDCAFTLNREKNMVNIYH